ncbi:hypothetical protein N5853_12260 [Bartonella sp. HY329]|uniref:hypothetical protein n=1 Tax=unclassified Bartonella TaxID=2645622 RepID=UPI0021C868D0|nr:MULTISPECIES: hypothetical protein [unclassified Bartonella]UXM94849.1 hypothetical protein N5853_12260 [Bartonella sp. HY329]UXN09172.1 hypothetical protein N5852_12270 [Bartonella sp. HY328]
MSNFFKIKKNQTLNQSSSHGVLSKPSSFLTTGGGNSCADWSTFSVIGAAIDIANMLAKKPTANMIESIFSSLSLW